MDLSVDCRQGKRQLGKTTNLSGWNVILTLQTQRISCEIYEEI